MTRVSCLVFVVAGALASASSAAPGALPTSDTLGANSASAEPAPVAQKDGGLDALEKKLKDPKEKERRAAVQELAKLATPAAWELVLDALKDASPMVADEAQLQLGKIDDAKTVELCFGKKGLESGDAWCACASRKRSGACPPSSRWARS
ncbi:MAG: HEAT repeat domain-containing protein [Planctomycetes bacterium]|nr:HEAT repeat domain-containing protein [Planctomycetota bacterium]